MKILQSLITLALLLTVSGLPADLGAQGMQEEEDYRRFSISVNAGATMPNNFSGLQFFRSDLNRRTTGTSNFGVGLEYALFPVWSLGADYGYTTVEGDNNPFTTTVHSIGLKNWFNLNRLYRSHALSEVLNPFLTFGFGYDLYNYESPTTEFDDSESYISFGLGLGVNLSETVEIFGQMDYHLGADKFDNQEREYYRSLLTMATGGIRFHLGSSDSRRLNMAPARMYMAQGRYDDIMGQEAAFADAQRTVDEQNAEIDRLRGLISGLEEERDEAVLCCEELAALRDSLENATIVTPQVRQMLVGALNDVNFEFDRSELIPASMPILDNAAELLNNYPDLDVVIEGHTDGVGSDEYNIDLSQRRADAVRDYLVSQGVNASRIDTEAFGESNPIGDNTTQEGRAMNRRVVFRIVE